MLEGSIGKKPGHVGQLMGLRGLSNRAAVAARWAGVEAAGQIGSGRAGDMSTVVLCGRHGTLLQHQDMWARPRLLWCKAERQTRVFAALRRDAQAAAGRL
jgi:hypothetical protein